MTVALPMGSGLGVSRYRPDVPVGSVIAFAGDLTIAKVAGLVVDQGWLPCDGRAVSQKTYGELYAVIGGLYTKPGGAKDQFCIPDYRGQFLRGLAAGAGQDPGFSSRIAPPGGSAAQSVGSSQGWMVQTHEHNFQALSGVEVGDAGSGGGVPPATKTSTTDLLASDGSALSGEETRPQNIYVNYLIKAGRAQRRLGVRW